MQRETRTVRLKSLELTSGSDYPHSAMATFKKWTSTVLVNGQPEPNVKVYVFSPGSTDQIPIYEDEGVTQITQPILTDSQGRYAFFVDVDAYPEIRLYLEKDGVDFSEVNEDLDGVPVPGAGGGAGTFTELTDTPSSYVGRGGDVVVVKNTEDGIETQPWPVTGTVLNVFLSSDAADIGDYYYMYHTETGDTHSEFTSPSLSTGDDQLLWSFVTEAGQPGLNQLALGAYTATLFLKKSGNKDVRVYWKLFKRDTSGNETEILESAVSDYLTTDNSQYLISAYLNEDQVLDPTDRLVLKLYANVSGTGTDVTVTLTMEGDYDSRLAIHVLSSAFSLDRLSDVTLASPSDNQMLAYDAGSERWTNQTPGEAGVLASDGSVPLTGDLDAAGHSINNLSLIGFSDGTSGANATSSDMTVYVDSANGSDTTGDGTPGNPYKTINHALSTLPRIIRHTVTIHLVASSTAYDAFDLQNFVSSGGEIIIEGEMSVVTSGNVSSISEEVNDPVYGSSVPVDRVDDSTASWASNAYQWKLLRVYKTGENDIWRLITANDATGLYVMADFMISPSSSWPTYGEGAPDNTWSYQVLDWGVQVNGTSFVRNVLCPVTIRNIYFPDSTLQRELLHIGPSFTSVNIIGCKFDRSSNGLDGIQAEGGFGLTVAHSIFTGQGGGKIHVVGSINTVYLQASYFATGGSWGVWIELNGEGRGRVQACRFKGNARGISGANATFVMHPLNYDALNVFDGNTTGIYGDRYGFFIYTDQCYFTGNTTDIDTSSPYSGSSSGA